MAPLDHPRSAERQPLGWRARLCAQSARATDALAQVARHYATSARRAALNAVDDLTVLVLDRPSWHTAAAGALAVTAGFTECLGPVAAPALDAGLTLATAGIAAHAIATVSRQYGCTQPFGAVFARTVRTTVDAPIATLAPARWLRFVCDVIDPDECARETLAPRLAQWAIIASTRAVARSVMSCVPGVGLAWQASSTASVALQHAAFVHALQLRAAEICAPRAGVVYAVRFGPTAVHVAPFALAA